MTTNISVEVLLFKWHSTAHFYEFGETKTTVITTPIRKEENIIGANHNVWLWFCIWLVEKVARVSEPITERSREKHTIADYFRHSVENCTKVK